nr:TPA: DNA polymerase B [Oryctes rhinoceros nudivirus]
MYRGNKEYFALKRQLVLEAKEKLNQLPVERSIGFNPANPLPKGLTFVYEWCDNGNEILGYGCNSDGDACCICPQIVPGLFVISCDPTILRQICALYGYEIKVYDIEYDTNNFAAWELLTDYNVCRPGNLVKIITHTVSNAERLYNKFKYNHSSYKYVGVSQYFNIVTQIMFEMIIMKNSTRYVNKEPMDYSVPKTTMAWFDEYLNVYPKYADPKVPIITFDIETVSSDPHRVPTGDDKDDILFTVSIHHTHTNVLYTLIYMPLKMRVSDMVRCIRDDGYDVIPDKSVDASKCSNVLECFNDERSLLVRTMDLLTLKPKLHILFGYNSIGYDIKYLLMRCAFYRIRVDRFIWREGYSFGCEQMHLDLFRIIVMRYRFKSYKLDDVSREILKDSKTGVSAVNLRYTFFRMMKYGRYFKTDESSAKIPSIKDTLEYNNADTLLVSKLESRTKCIPFIISRAMDCQVPLTSMNTNYNKMQFKLWSECFVVGISLRIFMATFKQPNAALKLPIASAYSVNDMIDVNVSLTDKLNSTSSDVDFSSSGHGDLSEPTYARYSSKKSQFPGGANFCLGEKNVDNVQMYDYVTAYPILMDRKNISDETTTVLAASILLMLYPKIQHKETFKVYDYMAHNGSTKSETIILYYQYIYDGLYCGGEFAFTVEELKKRQDSPVIVIWEGRRGILSRIIAHFSAVRAATKLKRKALDEVYDILIEKKNELATKQILMEEYNQQQLDLEVGGGDDVGCDVTDGTFGFDDDGDDDAVDDCSSSNIANVICDGGDDAFGFEDDDDNDEIGEVCKSSDVKSGDVDDDACIFGIEDDDDNVSTLENEAVSADVFGVEDFCCDEVEAAFGSGNCDNDMDVNSCNFGFEDDANVGEDVCDFGFDDCPDEMDGDTTVDDIVAVPNQSVTKVFENQPPLVSRFIQTFGNLCSINESELETESDPMSIISELAEIIALERNNTANSYDLQKSIVSSIYGCIGKMIVVVAAVITSMTRSTLLASAQYCRSLGCNILYIDTDSIMITGYNGDLSAELNRRFPFMEMEMKLARKCMFVKRKTYYKVEDGNFKYGQNVNGPSAWRECVEYFYNRNTITTNPDIYQAFFEFFMSIYKKLQSFDAVTPEFLQYFTQTIKTKDEYKTMTVAKRFKLYMAEKYPALAGASKHSIYYYLDNSVLIPCLRPELDITSKDDLRFVNLFKYYQNMYTTIFNLIKFHIKKNNEPYNITLSSKYILLLMLKGFLDAYEATFLTNAVTCKTDVCNNISLSSDADQIFTEPIHTEVLNSDPE